MQFSKIIITSILAVAASAVPTGGSGGSSPGSQCTMGDGTVGKVFSCIGVLNLNVLSCLIGNVIVGGGNYCCKYDGDVVGGLITINALNCAKIL